MLTNLTTPHEYPEKLFVVEGIDGSGKTTHLALLAKWLSAAGHSVVLTEWNSSALVLRRQIGTFLTGDGERGSETFDV